MSQQTNAKPIPPLPDEQGGSTIGARHMWVMHFPREPLSKEEVCRGFEVAFGREPDRCYSPEESATELWWLGWVSKAEAKAWVEMNKLPKEVV